MSLADLHALHLLRPWWLLALPPLWALAWRLARRHGGDAVWRDVIDPELLPGLQLEAGPRRVGSPWPWLALAWTLAVVALAGPTWEQDSGPAFRRSLATVLVIDLSASMGATDVSPDRVTRARYALDDVLSTVQDGQVGLIAFSGEAFTVAPLTHDVATLQSLLQPLAPDLMPTTGDRLAPALQRARELLTAAGAQRARILVVTDGVDDSHAAEAVARELNAAGIEVSVLAVGTETGAPLPNADGGYARRAGGGVQMTWLDPKPLQALARSGGGQFAELSGLPSMLRELRGSVQAEAAAQQADDVTLRQWRDAGVWLMPVLLLLGAAFARRGWL